MRFVDRRYCCTVPYFTSSRQHLPAYLVQQAGMYVYEHGSDICLPTVLLYLQLLYVLHAPSYFILLLQLREFSESSRLLLSKNLKI